MKFERKLKNKSIFTVMMVLFILCAIYFSLGIKNQKQYVDWQIQKENDIVNLEIRNLLNTTNQLYRDKIHYFVNNPEIKKEFGLKNTEELYRKVFPFYTILRSEDPYHFIINFYSKKNDLILNMETGNGSDIKAKRNSVVAEANNDRRKKTGFEFTNSSLYYKVVEPVIVNGEYIGCIEFGVRENEIVERITHSFEVTVASFFNPKKINAQLSEDFKASVSNEKFLVHSVFEKEIFSDILANNELLVPGKFKYNENYFYLDIIKVDNNFQNEGFEGVAYFRDISAQQNKFFATVYRSILIIFLILVATFIILHFSFNVLIHKIFNLQDSLDKRLAQKTREIVNKNAELNQIFNTTGNSMRLIDLDHTIIRVNRAFTTLSGISKEDAEGKKCYNIFPGPNCHTAECPLNQIKNGEDKIEVDIKKKNKQGKIIPGILTSVAFKGQGGEMLGIIEDFKDISKRIDAEDALERTEQQFSVFMDNLPLGVFIKDENLKSVYLNKYMDFIFSNDNCQDKTPQEIFPEEYAKRVIEEDKQVLNGEVLVVEDQLPDKSGDLRSYQTHKFRYRGIDNSWQIGGISLDITDKKKTEHDLKILSNAIHHSPACVIITNLKREIQFVNPSFTQITGYNPEDVINKEISILNSDDRSNSIYEDAMKVVLSGKDWQGEFHHRKKNGEKYWELASISSVKNNTGEMTHFVVISDDITSRKKSENELIDAKEKAEESNRLKTAFLANLSHEIRTPMNAIIGFSNLLLDEDISLEEKVKLNNLINNNSQNLLKLIDDVIDISRIQSGNIELHKTECFINKLLLDLYVSFSIKVENDDKKDIHLSMNKGSDLKDFSIITDSVRLKQIMYNLIENAIKFTSKGFVEFGYTIIEEDNKIQFYIVDSGIGISNEKFDMIYDLFRQADESFTREYGGTGIGLTIAKKLVDHLDGEIWVQSTPDQGTNIYFSLPLIENDSKFENSNENIKNQYDWQNKVVLVADDIDINYRLIEEILMPTKAKILWAKDGKEAVDLCLNNDNIDIVLMDIKMPVMNGLEATQKIKEHKRNLKIIGQTAYAHDNDREKCLSAGFDNYISKPIKIESLLSSINEVFSKN
ncbi:MAG: PAS domain S-box protein [Bacteroidales bacterium]|nr:PAS domain S-box protein [Bacteroidales bacterium]